MNLSPNFVLAEFIISQEAERRGIDNTPTPEIITHLTALCVAILEPLRQALGPVRVSSGYRSPALNAAIGGAKDSQHMTGHAADISVNGRTLDEVYNWLYDNAPFDQVIREFPPGGWVHVSHDPGRGRRQGLRATRGADGRTIYEQIGRLA